MAVLSSKKKAAKKAAPKKPPHIKYEPSHFVWLHKWQGEARQPALVLWAEDEHGNLIVYVTPTTKKGDTGRRTVPYHIIEGRIT